MARQVGPGGAGLQPRLRDLLWGAGAAIRPPHAAAVPMRLYPITYMALWWLSALGGRLDVALATGQGEGCLLPALALRRPNALNPNAGRPGGGVRVSGPARAASSASLLLWQLDAGQAQITAVGDPRCSYHARCAGGGEGERGSNGAGP